MRKIILASASPRRKELLGQLLGNKFQVSVSSYKETPLPGLGDPEALLLRHSSEKARDVAGHFSSGIIIAAYTSVILGDEVLGKPHTPEKAKEMLEKLSGKTVKVITGLTVLDLASGREINESETTVVRMKRMDEKEIEAYVRTGEPLDKAGAFAIQGKGALLVERVEGDFFNVVGLPLFRLGRILERLGVSIFEEA